jgi:hypothetical protein
MDDETKTREYRKAFIDMMARGTGTLRIDPTTGSVKHVPWEDTRQEPTRTGDT